MYPHLFCLSVVFLSRVLECLEDAFFWDVSDNCANGRNFSTYLTNGMGISDAFVFLIAKAEKINCTLNFNVSKGKYVVLVVEFLDWISGTSLCGNPLNEVNVMVREKEVINICAEGDVANLRNSIYRAVGKESASLSVTAEDGMDCMKIIATSVRNSSGKECYEYESKCPYENQIFCMTEELQCDGNVNCGIRDEFDEDKNQCEKYLTITPAMVIVGSGIAFLSFTLVVALLKNILPNRKGTFIFKEDETLSERDRATSQKDFQVKLKILYSPNDVANVDTISLEEDNRAVNRQGIFGRKLRNLSKDD